MPVVVHQTSAGYTGTLGIGLVQGRMFDASEVERRLPHIDRTLMCREQAQQGRMGKDVHTEEDKCSAPAPPRMPPRR